MEFPGIHAVHRINRLAGARFTPSTCVHPRGSLASSLGLNDRNSMEPATLSDGNNKRVRLTANGYSRYQKTETRRR